MTLILCIRWYATILIAGWLAFPLAYRFFGSLPDRGYSFSKVVGCLAVSYLFWALGSLGPMRVDVGSLLGAAGIVGATGALWLGASRFQELRAWLGQNRRYVLASEFLFLLALAAFALVRAFTPEILGTEKPMEYMFLNSILRSGAFPAQDAWLSGHAISYYHFGYIMIAALTLASGAPSAMAFNLGLATLFGLTALSSSGVALNLIAHTRGPSRRAPPGSALLRCFWPALMAPALILLVGNLYGALELAHDNGYLADLRVPAVYYGYGDPGEGGAGQAPRDFAAEPGIRLGRIDIWSWLDLKRLDPLPPGKASGPGTGMDNWFFASRVVHDRNLIGVEKEAIDEFPAFSFLLGDMHPHVLSLPFVFLAMGLAFEWMIWGWRRSESGASDVEMVRSEVGRVVFSSLVLGGVAFLNFWDFPVYWFVVVGALAVGIVSGRDSDPSRHGYRNWLGIAAAIGVVALAMYLPFYVTFQSQAGGVLPNVVYPTHFRQMAVMFAPLLLGVLLLIAVASRRPGPGLELRLAARIGGAVAALLIMSMIILTLVAFGSEADAGPIQASIAPLSFREALGLIAERRLAAGLSTLVPAGIVGLSGALIVGLGRRTIGERRGGWGDVPGARRPLVDGQGSAPAGLALSMALLLALTGGLLLIGPEYVYLRDNFGTRMNTIFKLYFQVWAMWGLATAFALWYLWQERRRAVEWALVAATGVAILLGLVYTAGTLTTITEDFRPPATLDGMAYFARQYPDDWAAILWLRENAPGSAVILEGTKGAYWIEGRSSRISMATGNPTLMGWINHESQWRGSDFERVAGRIQDIETIYRTGDWDVASQLLEKYGVEYVITSPLEAEWYGSVDFTKFERHMRMVFKSGEVQIYQP